jgi:DNA-binding CsgD family transcriptional regulator
MLAHALIERGQLDAAASALAPIDEAEMKTRIDYALLLEARARLELERGNSRIALRDAEGAGRLFQEVFAMRTLFIPWRPTGALAAASLGETMRARTLLDEELEIAEAIGAPTPIGRALRTRGLVEGGERGLELLSEAVSVLEPAAPRLEHVRALVDYGAALRRAGHRRAARQPLQRGFEVASQGGALALAARARVELAALGARPRKQLRTGTDALTPSERRIARMAASGMTNKQIAQALFVTLKDVEWHLHHTYQKLDITSRTELDHALGANE